MADKSLVLRAARRKIDRATEHLNKLVEFLDSCSHLSFYFDYEIDQNGQAWAILRFDAIPEEASIICGEFAFQARSSLDVAFVQIALHSGSKIEKLAFPFATQASHLTSPNKTQCRHLAEVPVGIRNIIIAAAPHEEAGGNEHLIALHEICNLDKHNDLISAAANGLNFSNVPGKLLRNDIERFVVPTMIGALAGSSFQQGERIYRDGFRFEIPDIVLKLCTADEAVRMTGRSTRLPYNIAFKNTKNLNDVNVVRACTAMRDEVLKLLDSFELELLLEGKR